MKTPIFFVVLLSIHFFSGSFCYGVNSPEDERERGSVNVRISEKDTLKLRESSQRACERACQLVRQYPEMEEWVLNQLIGSPAPEKLEDFRPDKRNRVAYLLGKKCGLMWRCYEGPCFLPELQEIKEELARYKIGQKEESQKK